MNGCNCLRVRREAGKGEFAFLLEQIERCESCACKQQVPQVKEETYKVVCLQYVDAYWREFRR